MSRKVVILLVAYLSIIQVSAQGFVKAIHQSAGRRNVNNKPSVTFVGRSEDRTVPPLVDIHQEGVNKTEDIVLQPMPHNMSEPSLPSDHRVEQSTTEGSVPEPDHNCVNGVQYDKRLSLELSKGVLRLGQDILNKFLDDRDDQKNTEVISPTCIMGALLLPMLGSYERTYDEFMWLIRGKVTSGNTVGSFELHKEFSLLLNDAITTEQYTILERPSDPWRYTPHKYMNRPLKAINDTSHYKLRIANGIFVHESFRLRDLYKQAVREGYKTQIKTFDFRNKAEDARQCINSLIKSKTNGKIDQILANPISAQTNLIIVSSLYFNAKWERPFFDRGATRLQNFYPNGLQKTPVQTLMMSTGGLYPYYNDTQEGCQIIGLPYKGNLTTMYVIIPYNSDREVLREFHKNLTADKVDRLISKMALKTTTMVFPKMDIKNTIRLKSVFSELGLTKFFNPSESDLSLITDKEAVVSEREETGNCLDADSDLEDSRVDSVQENSLGDMITPTLPPITTTVPETQIHVENEEPSYAMDDPVRITESPNLISDRTPCYNLVNRGAPICGGQTDAAPTHVASNGTHKKSKSSSQSYSHYGHGGRVRRNIGGSCTDTGKDLYGFRGLEELREIQGLPNPNIYADEIVHKLDLTVNEQGTEGGAATAATLHRNSPEVPLRVEVPFIFLIRHDPTRLPIFYGLVYNPTTHKLSV